MMMMPQSVSLIHTSCALWFALIGRWMAVSRALIRHERCTSFWNLEKPHLHIPGRATPRHRDDKLEIVLRLKKYLLVRHATTNVDYAPNKNGRMYVTHHGGCHQLMMVVLAPERDSNSWRCWSGYFWQESAPWQPHSHIVAFHHINQRTLIGFAAAYVKLDHRSLKTAMRCSKASSRRKRRTPFE